MIKWEPKATLINGDAEIPTFFYCVLDYFHQFVSNAKRFWTLQPKVWLRIGCTYVWNEDLNIKKDIQVGYCSQYQ